MPSVNSFYILCSTEFVNFCPSENPAKSPTKNDTTKKIKQVFVEILWSSICFGSLGGRSGLGWGYGSGDGSLRAIFLWTLSKMVLT